MARSRSILKNYRLGTILLVTLLVALLLWICLHRDAPSAGSAHTDASTLAKPPAKNSGASAKAAGAPTSVSTSLVSQRDLPVVQTGLGTVVAAASVTVHARVSGQLEKVLFQEGQEVNKGDLLAEIDARPFRADLAQSEGQATRNRALLENAERDLKRFESLKQQSTISQQQIDAQKSLVAQYQGAVQTDQGAIDKAKLQLSFTRITAPISGRIGLRQVDSGNNISPNDGNGLAVITSTHPIDVVFSLPEDNVAIVANKLRSAQKKSASLTVEAWDKSNKLRIAEGELITLDNQIDPTTGTIKLKARFNNSDQQLFPNQFINVRLLLDTNRQATVVPNTAIQRGANGAFVYVVQQAEVAAGENGNGSKPDASTVTVRPVKLGASDINLTAVESGLQAGEVVVTNGSDKLREGAKVLVIAEKNKEAAPGKDSLDAPRHYIAPGNQKNITANP